MTTARKPATKSRTRREDTGAAAPHRDAVPRSGALSSADFAERMRGLVREADRTTTRSRTPRYDIAGVVRQICAEVASGATLRALLTAPGMPSKSQFFLWLFQDDALATEYRAARAFAADVLAEELEESAEAAITCTSMVEVAARRLKFDTLKWSLAKRAPKRYGETSRIETADGVALTTFSLGISTA